MFIYRDASDPVGRLELALQRVAEAEGIEAKVRAAVRSGAVGGFAAGERIAAAVRLGVITGAEAEALKRYEELRRACIMVDDFPPDVGRHAAADPVGISAFEEALVVRKTA
jgi:acyl-CoA dehydrogenase